MIHMKMLVNDLILNACVKTTETGFDIDIFLSRYCMQKISILFDRFRFYQLNFDNNKIVTS